MKKIFCFILAACILAGMCPAFAVSGNARAVMGADLTDDQKQSVFDMFGTERGTVTELTVTNAEEREWLSGLLDESVIGTRAISCVYVEPLGDGEGFEIEVYNVNWCTAEMYESAMITAGIDDARIVVAAPFEVSGTAALTGIYKAWEDITGEKLDDAAKTAAEQELVNTAELSDYIGGVDALELVREIKLLLVETEAMTDEELAEQIDALASEYDLELTESQREKLIKFCRSLEGMSEEELREKVEKVKDTIAKATEATEKAGKLITALKNVFAAIGRFFSGLFGKLRD